MPPSVKATTVSVELTAVCVTVNAGVDRPGLGTLCRAGHRDLVAPSLSVMFRLAAVVSTLMPAFPLVIGETSVTVTVSVGSTTASLITGIVIVAVVLPAGIVTECVMAV